MFRNSGFMAIAIGGVFAWSLVHVACCAQVFAQPNPLQPPTQFPSPPRENLGDVMTPPPTESIPPIKMPPANQAKPAANSEPAPRPVKITKTIIEMEILIPANGTSSTVAQKWGSALSKSGISAVFRTERAGDQNTLKQKVTGQTRWINIVADLEPSGKLMIGKKSFMLDEFEQFQQWINDIETFGAQGRPEGEPNWGLTAAQYDVILGLLSPVVEQNTAGLSITDALKSWDNIPNLPLTFSATARAQLLNAPTLPIIQQNVKGISKGSALSIVLSELNLRFYPRRTPEGAIHLMIETPEQIVEAWPIGYNLEAMGTTRLKAAPSLLKIQTFDFEKKPIRLQWQETGASTGVPIFVDETSIREVGINLDQITISQNYQKLSSSLLLKKISIANKLDTELLLDEGGHPFVWVTPFIPKPLK